MKKYKEYSENGFSLIELVVTVGILAVLSAVGLVAYNGVIGKAWEAAVNNTAATVYNGAMVYETDNLPETTFQTAIDEWNKSAGVELPESIATINIVAGIGVNEEKIVVEGSRLKNNAFEIKAAYGSKESPNRIEVVKRSTEVKSSGNENTDSGDGGVITQPSTTASCFEFDASTHTITKYKDSDDNGTECPRNVVIPSSINGVEVNHIGEAAFKMPSEAFKKPANPIESVVFPETLISIGEHAFAHNILEEVIIPEGVESISFYAFAHNEISSLTLPDSLTRLESSVFTENKLTSVVIPDSLNSIEDYVFYNNQITNVTIGNSVKTIGYAAFYDNNLTSVTIPDTVTTIGHAAFEGNQLTNVTIGNSVKTITNQAFSRNNLTSVTIPDSVTTIGPHAFTYNYELVSVELPSHFKGTNLNPAFADNGQKFPTFTYRD